MRAGSIVDLAFEEPYRGVRRRSFDGDGATVTEYVMEAGARFPLHRHPQEQIALVDDGEVEVTVAGERRLLGPGDWFVVGPEVEHGIEAARDARFLVILVPRRPSSSAYTVVE